MNVLSAGLENPILGYKLDPGEPGLSHSAPASRSILRVVSQEISNWLAFEREAAKNGGIIIHGGINLDLRRKGSFLAAVAGKTTAWIYYPNGEKVQDNSNEYKDQLRKQIRELENKLEAAINSHEKEKIEQQLNFLKLMLNMPAKLIEDLLKPLGIFLDVFA